MWPSYYYCGVVVVLMTGTYGLQKVNERLISLTWTLYMLGQAVGYLKNWSWGLYRQCTVCDHSIYCMV